MRYALLSLLLLFPSLSQATDAKGLSWVEDGPVTPVSQTCAGFRLHGVMAQSESRNFEFFMVGYLGCSWLSQQPALVDENDTLNPLYTQYASSLNALGTILLDFARDDHWLTETGSHLIATQTGTVSTMKALHVLQQ